MVEQELPKTSYCGFKHSAISIFHVRECRAQTFVSYFEIFISDLRSAVSTFRKNPLEIQIFRIPDRVGIVVDNQGTAYESHVRHFRQLFVVKVLSVSKPLANGANVKREGERTRPLH